MKSEFFSMFGIPPTECEIEARKDELGVPRLWFRSTGNPLVGLDLTGEDLDRPGSPKQKDRRRPAVLSFTVGVDALDFALALDSGRYGSLMSLVGASRCENLSIKPNLC